MQILSISYSIWLIIILLTAAGLAAYITGKLTGPASATGVIVALLIYVGTGIAGLAMLAAFFVLGTAATSFKKEYKLKMRLATSHEERRTIGQVLGNAGLATIISILSVLFEGNHSILLVMIAASFASATGDTFSSEFGNVYGRNFYNFTTFRKDERGLNGVISMEGTLFGIFGSAVISLIYTIFAGWGFSFFAILIAGVCGNFFDSLLGALFERNGWLGNNAVNFLNTAFASLITLLLMQS